MWYLLTCLSISYQIAFLFIYSTFAAKYLNSLDEKETAIYDKLINKPSNDWEIYYWAIGRYTIH
jgi:succinate dehydrogenase flavin-adding protein (antitoxin of CptAB toxin-antitoxin module)